MGPKISQEPTNYSLAYQMIIEDLDGILLIYSSAPKEDQPFQDLETPALFNELE